MNRNVESHFSQLPDIDIQRSIFDRSFDHMTSFNVGELIPFYLEEILPGDTFQVSSSKVIRLQTLLTPVFSNLYADFYYFFVPMRLTWNHAKEFFGENNSSAWIPQVSYTVPSISSPSGGFSVGTIADYMGLPVGVSWNNQAVNRPIALPFRAYALICNEFFRDENLTDPLNIPLGDSNQTGSNGSNYVNDVANGGKPFKVAKYHDYFTSALPSPQKGQSVELGLFQNAPVFASSTPFGNDSTIWKSDYNNAIHVKGITSASSNYNVFVWANNGNTLYDTGSSVTASNAGEFIPDNLWADLENASGVSINELRLAFQLQKYYEKLARGGSRYTEYVRQMFNVVSPDATLQRPEYLGGNRVPINIHEVMNNAQTSTDFLGDLGAMSVTSDIHEDFTHSFTEHGYVIGVCCLRYDHSYPQGMEKLWLRRDTTDYYLPVFANIGEQPVEKCEIYADATTIANSSVFGYNEAYASYRFKNDRCSAEMRPGVSGSLASWHFADYYNSAPTLSDAWIREDKTNVDRTLAVTSANSNQAFMDIYVKNICTRPMPMYSIPGLIDHH